MAARRALGVMKVVEQSGRNLRGTVFCKISKSLAKIPILLWAWFLLSGATRPFWPGSRHRWSRSRLAGVDSGRD